MNDRACLYIDLVFLERHAWHSISIDKRHVGLEYRRLLA